MMPRPVLRDSFGLAYRKIPVLLLGREVCAAAAAAARAAGVSSSSS